MEKPDRKAVFDRLKEILSFEYTDSAQRLESCTESSELVADLGLNSVGLLFMVISIEEAFGMRFENVSFKDFRTIGDVIDYICIHAGEKK